MASGDYRRFMGPNYRKGYSGRNYHVTGGHEAEALEEERAKQPNRFGVFVLRLLGYKGPIGRPPDSYKAASRHQHPPRSSD